MASQPATSQLPQAVRSEELRELSDWRPPLGVLSVYAAGDPADRGDGWRIAVRNGLRQALEDAAKAGHERESAIRATARRVEERIEDMTEVPRGLALFCEIADEPAEERRFTTNLELLRPGVFHGERAWLAPLVRMMNAGRPAGVAILSAERVRLFDWRQGRGEEVESWVLELFLDDWRERKAQRPPDPAGAQAISSSGKDQYDQRLEANRDRFLTEAATLTLERVRDRDWQELITFGPKPQAARFGDGLGAGVAVHHAEDADLISVPEGEIDHRIAEKVPEIQAQAERELVASLDEHAYDEGRASFGKAATMQALEQGRVDHLLYSWEDNSIETEQMLELAIATAAKLTPVSDEQAVTGLEPHGGVAALLRY